MNQETVLKIQNTAADLSNLRALLVLRHGAVVCEYYDAETTSETLLQGRSITKSVVSALIGIAIDQGLIRSVDDKILDYFPEYTSSDGARHKRDITIDHVLTMTSGFAWDNDVSWYDDDAPAAEYHALDRPLRHLPGTVFNYDSAAADLLTVILTRVTHQSARTFASEHLFAPLGINRFDWERDPAGYDRGSAGLIMRPLDVAKFGQLYLQKGRWNGQQLIPQDWVEQSTTTQVRTPNGAGYGRCWWVENAGHSRQFSGIGFCAQYLTVMPHLELVVVAHHHIVLSENIANQQEHEFTHRILKPIRVAVEKELAEG